MTSLSQSLITQLEDLKIKLKTVETALKEKEEKKYIIPKNISIIKLHTLINSLSTILDYKPVEQNTHDKYKSAIHYTSIREELISIRNKRTEKNNKIFDNFLQENPTLPQNDEINLINEEIFIEMLDIINKQHHRISVLEAILS